MTGRELIIHILQNNLEDEEVFKDGKLIGFMTVEEAAVKFGVGTATIEIWAREEIINSIKISNYIFIPANEKNPTITYQKQTAGDLFKAYMNVVRGNDV